MRIVKIEENERLSWLRPVSSSRAFQLGLAMIMVMIYHLTNIGFYDWVILKPFHAVGFGGVDIFMFFSAYGLCYSLNKNTLPRFYLRRIIRIYPLFLLCALFSSLWADFYMGMHLSVFDYLCNLTSLCYYGIGGTRFEWYLCSLFLLYLLFPVLKFLAVRFKEFGICFFIFLSVSLYAVFHIYWEYDCLVSRVPIFLLGILFFESQNDESNRYPYFVIILLILSIVLYFSGCSRFLYVSLAMPVVIALNSVIYRVMKKCPLCNVVSLVEWIGKYSLEFYSAQIFSMRLVKAFQFPDNSIYILLLYTVFQSVITVLLINVNRRIQTYIQRVYNL